jgi:hypothetical protein
MKTLSVTYSPRLGSVESLESQPRDGRVNTVRISRRRQTTALDLFVSIAANRFSRMSVLQHLAEEQSVIDVTSAERPVRQ